MESDFKIELVQLADYRFETHFDNAAVPALLTDEQAPLGGDAGPNPSRLLLTSVANCLMASLLFAMRKFKNEPGPLRAVAKARIIRNANNRLRIGRIAVDLNLGVIQPQSVVASDALAAPEQFAPIEGSLILHSANLRASVDNSGCIPFDVAVTPRLRSPTRASIHQ